MDPYKILGIHPGASQDQIKRAYRTQATKLHPDKGGSAEAFTELHHAYESVKENKTGRYSIPIKGQYNVVQVNIPLEKLVVSASHDIEYQNQIYEVTLPDWQPDWVNSHTFIIDQYQLKLQVEVNRSNYYIKNHSLCREFKINQIESLVGTTVILDEETALKVPAGIVTGSEIKVTGLGFKKGNFRADLTCIFIIEPVQLSSEDMNLSLNDLIGKYTKKYD